MQSGSVSSQSHYYQHIKGDNKCFLVVCDHASNHIPSTLELGISDSDKARHIAYDLGAAGVATTLAEALGCPLIMAGFSRLVIDPNRGLDDPTLIIETSDGTNIIGNHNIDDETRKVRIQTYYEPYHHAIATVIEEALSVEQIPIILSIHSFTPHLSLTDKEPRPWEIGLLWDKDDRVKSYIEKHIPNRENLTMGDNQPYTGQLYGDCMYRHGTRRGLPHCLIELRQDEIATSTAQSLWGRRLAEAVRDFPNTQGYCISHYGSVFD